MSHALQSLVWASLECARFLAGVGQNHPEEAVNSQGVATRCQQPILAAAGIGMHQPVKILVKAPTASFTKMVSSPARGSVV